MNHFYKKNKLTPIINVSGFMTKIGASICKNDNIKAAKEILPFFVNIDELQLLASKRISKQLGCESAVITASSSSALTESVAATITGKDLQKIYKLPRRYIFYPAMYLPHKNHKYVVDTIRIIKSEYQIKV